MTSWSLGHQGSGFHLRFRMRPSTLNSDGLCRLSKPMGELQFLMASLFGPCVFFNSSVVGEAQATRYLW